MDFGGEKMTKFDVNFENILHIFLRFLTKFVSFAHDFAINVATKHELMWPQTPIFVGTKYAKCGHKIC